MATTRPTWRVEMPRRKASRIDALECLPELADQFGFGKPIGAKASKRSYPVFFVCMQSGDRNRDMEGNREKITLLSAPLQNFIPCSIICLIQCQTIFGIINLLYKILVYPCFDIKNKIVDHGFFPCPCPLELSLWTSFPANVKHVVQQMIFSLDTNALRF